MCIPYQNITCILTCDSHVWNKGTAPLTSQHTAFSTQVANRMAATKRKTVQNSATVAHLPEKSELGCGILHDCVLKVLGNAETTKTRMLVLECKLVNLSIVSLRLSDHLALQARARRGEGGSECGGVEGEGGVVEMLARRGEEGRDKRGKGGGGGRGGGGGEEEMMLNSACEAVQAVGAVEAMMLNSNSWGNDAEFNDCHREIVHVSLSGVCVCVRERERERTRKKETQRQK